MTHLQKTVPVFWYGFSVPVSGACVIGIMLCMYLTLTVVGLLCVAKFTVDGTWYRAKIVDLKPSGLVTVLYVDYGNTESLPLSSVCKLLHRFLALPTQVSSLHNVSVN